MRPSSKPILLVLLLLPFAGAPRGGEVVSAAPAGDGGHPARPNVLLYLIDTLRADHLGCYGYGRETSPIIDRLAGEGVLFEKTYAQAPWTKPSTASILTSNYPSTHGAVLKAGVAIRPEVVTLAEALRDRGYHTAAFVANAWVDGKLGFAQGFDEFHRMREFRPPARDPKTDRVARRTIQRAAAINRVVFPWLDDHGEEPFFLYVHAIDPHDPYTPVHPFDRFDEGYEGTINGFVPQMKRLENTRTRLSDEDLHHLVALYDGEIQYADHHFGRLLDRLRRMGLLDETLIVLTSDHGEEFFDHGGYRHGKNLYEFMIRIPLVMRFPAGLPAGRRVGALTQSIDIMPTILDLVGIEAPQQAQGKSLLPVVTGSAPSVNRVAYVERSIEGRKRPHPVLLAVVSDRWKLITYPGGRHRIYNRAGLTRELFDLREDPGERRNLAEEERRRVVTFQERLSHWLASQARWGESPQSETVEFDPESIEELEALGYID